MDRFLRHLNSQICHLSSTMFYIFSLFIISTNFALCLDQDWDLNFACREDLKRLSNRQAQMAKCAVDNSAPPQVCTNCYMQYAQLREEEYKKNYVVSYAFQMSAALEKQVWGKARCNSCLLIRGDLAHGNATFELDNKTSNFQYLLSVWRDCISNATLLLRNIKNNNLYKNKNFQQNNDFPFVCTQCTKQFDALFDFYWKIYTAPNIDFCVDVEAMMNDTMSLWHDVLSCKDDPRTEDRHQDLRVAAFSATLLAIVIGLFYAGSYIQTEQSQTQLIQYSRRQAIQEQRSRLLSSSTLDTFATPGSSMQG